MKIFGRPRVILRELGGGIRIDDSDIISSPFADNLIMLTSLEIIGAIEVEELSFTNYVLVGYYNDGTVKTISEGIWEVDSDFATIEKGLLITSDIDENKIITIKAGFKNQVASKEITIIPIGGSITYCDTEPVFLEKFNDLVNWKVPSLEGVTFNTNNQLEITIEPNVMMSSISMNHVTNPIPNNMFKVPIMFDDANSAVMISTVSLDSNLFNNFVEMGINISAVIIKNSDYSYNYMCAISNIDGNNEQTGEITYELTNAVLTTRVSEESLSILLSEIILLEVANTQPVNELLNTFRTIQLESRPYHYVFPYAVLCEGEIGKALSDYTFQSDVFEIEIGDFWKGDSSTVVTNGTLYNTNPVYQVTYYATNDVSFEVECDISTVVDGKIWDLSVLASTDATFILGNALNLIKYRTIGTYVGSNIVIESYANDTLINTITIPSVELSTLLLIKIGVIVGVDGKFSLIIDDLYRPTLTYHVPVYYPMMIVLNNNDFGYNWFNCDTAYEESMYCDGFPRAIPQLTEDNWFSETNNGAISFGSPLTLSTTDSGTAKIISNFSISPDVDNTVKVIVDYDVKLAHDFYIVLYEDQKELKNVTLFIRNLNFFGVDQYETHVLVNEVDVSLIHQNILADGHGEVTFNITDGEVIVYANATPLIVPITMNEPFSALNIEICATITETTEDTSAIINTIVVCNGDISYRAPLSSIEISGPSFIEEEEIAEYTAIATLMNETSSSITPEWEVLDQTVVINSNGQITGPLLDGLGRIKATYLGKTDKLSVRFYSHLRITGTSSITETGDYNYVTTGGIEPYTWTITSNPNVSINQSGTLTVTSLFDGSITVTCTDSLMTETTLNVTVSLPVAFSISGPNSISSVGTYQYNHVGGTSPYVWNVMNDDFSDTSIDQNGLLTVNSMTNGMILVYCNDSATHQDSIWVQLIDSSVSIPSENLLLLIQSDNTNGYTTFVDTGTAISCPHAIVNPDLKVIHSTDTAKFSSSSVYFNPNELGSYLNVADDPLFTFGSSNFTIDLWINIPDYGGGTIISQGHYVYLLNWWEDTITFKYSTGPQTWSYTSTITRTLNEPLVNWQWYHLAVVRFENVIKIFVDGIQLGVDHDMGGIVTLREGWEDLSLGKEVGFSSPFFLWAYCSEIRVCNFAIWTENFTPPTDRYIP